MNHNLIVAYSEVSYDLTISSNKYNGFHAQKV